jgi:hypothetical protein
MKVENLTIEESTNNTIYVTTIAGTNGTNGVTGPTGANGTNGVTGPTGVNGTNGIDGVTGPTGANGTNGIDGVTGPTGANGDNLQSGQYYGNYLYWNTNSTIPSWQVGSDKISIGQNSGQNMQGSDAIAIGTNAGQDIQGPDSVAIGFYAGHNNQGTGSIAIGERAGEGIQGPGSIAIGIQAGIDNQGKSSIAVGNGAGNKVQQSNAVAIGISAGLDKQGENSIAIGAYSASNNQQFNSIAIGHQAGLNMQGSGSVAIGISSGAEYQQSNSIAIGISSGAEYQQSNSIAIGNEAGLANQTPNSIAIGYMAGSQNISNKSLMYTVGNGINTIFYNDYSTNSSDGWLPIDNKFNSCNSVYINTDTEGNVINTGMAGIPNTEANAIAFINGDQSDADIEYESQTVISEGYCITYSNGFWFAGGTVGTDSINSIIAIKGGDDPDTFFGVKDSAESLLTCYTIGVLNGGVATYIGGVPKTLEGSSVYRITLDGGPNDYTIASSNNTLLSKCRKILNYFDLKPIYASGEGTTCQLTTSSDGESWTAIAVLNNNIPIFTTIYDFIIDDEKPIYILVGTNGTSGVIAYSTTLSNSSIWTVVDTIFTISANSITYNSKKNIYEVVGEGENTNAYSTDGITWTSYTIQGLDSGLGISVNTQENNNSNIIAIGNSAGMKYQSDSAIAIGTNTGYENQGANSIALGSNAGGNNQGANSIALGSNAGENNQGANSIAIGNLAGKTDQSQNSIILNASVNELSTSATGFYVSPINKNNNTLILSYNTNTSEINYQNNYYSSATTSSDATSGLGPVFLFNNTISTITNLTIGNQPAGNISSMSQVFIPANLQWSIDSSITVINCNL